MKIGPAEQNRRVDLLELYRRAQPEFIDRVGQIGPEDWSAPTPCADWDVRTLVNHVVGEDRWTVPLLAGATIDEVGDRFAGDLLGADPVERARDSAAQAEVAVSRPGALEHTVHLSVGDTPAREYLRQLISEHLVHGWDLAVSIGAPPRLDVEAVRETVRWFAEREQSYRDSGIIHGRVEVPPDASEQDQLLGAFGRDPTWHPPR
ncbi:TIGR03086 family metal-binding protein [Micromonospora sp. NPDC049679]|uniref:TIGR03086 family metal-binding protein n=1 Tax=Micromonospora sp. NPDC049679 TaxID=3155920 RepID=UPI0033C3EE7A